MTKKLSTLLLLLNIMFLAGACDNVETTEEYSNDNSPTSISIFCLKDGTSFNRLKVEGTDDTTQNGFLCNEDAKRILIKVTHIGLLKNALFTTITCSDGQKKETKLEEVADFDPEEPNKTQPTTTNWKKIQIFEVPSQLLANMVNNQGVTFKISTVLNLAQLQGTTVTTHERESYENDAIVTILVKK